MGFDPAAVVAAGACMGCGLCAGVAPAIRMAETPEGRERPAADGPLSPGDDADIAAACPGLVVAGLSAEAAGAGAADHPVWGRWRRARIGWAGDPAIRWRGSAGGALSALAAFLVESGRAEFVLHVAPDPARPAHSRWRISETAAAAADTGGSRYGPAAPLAGLAAAQARGGRFAFIGKPCDVSAIRLLARRRGWLRERLTLTLAFMCGGASEFAKTRALLARWAVDEGDLVSLRYRGEGNPGPTAAVDRAGARHEIGYRALWEDETAWALQHRCKICPDSIGMAADLVAFDCWPGGAPAGEDEGFNALLTRTPAGDALLSDAAAAGALVLGRALGPEDFETFQPHQSRQRRAAGARLAGQRAAAGLAPRAEGLGLARLARGTPLRDLLAEARGVRRRLYDRRGAEIAPRPAGAGARRSGKDRPCSSA